MAGIGEEGTGVCKHADKVAQKAEVCQSAHLIFHSALCVIEPPCGAELDLARNLIRLEAAQQCAEQFVVDRVQGVEDCLGALIGAVEFGEQVGDAFAAVVGGDHVEACVSCGHVATPLDTYTFAQINDGNAISIPFALGFGWGGDLNLEYIFEKLFSEPFGGGYPKERVVPGQRNKKILDAVRASAFRPLKDILCDLDPELVKGAFAGEHFDEYFFRDCKDEEIASLVKKLKNP